MLYSNFKGLGHFETKFYVEWLHFAAISMDHWKFHFVADFI